MPTTCRRWSAGTSPTTYATRWPGRALRPRPATRPSEPMMVPFASWSVLSADFLIVLHLTISGVTLSALLHLASAKWRYEVRQYAISLFGLYPLAFALLLILLAFG